MSFFDDKQEILKVELTTYGRFLISRGKFKPAYYAFFDDDVLYDGEYADVDETQSSIQTRILDETLSLKPQTTFTSLENNVKLSTLLFRELDKLKTEEAQISADKNYALSLPLANSDMNSDYAPAWSFYLLDGNIAASSQYIDNSNGNLDVLQPFIKYPQIELNDLTFDIKLGKNDFSVEKDYEIIYSFSSNGDDYYYSMKEASMLVDLKEINVEDLQKNFDIELFIEELELVPGTDETKTILKQLNFKKETIQILNGILLDEPKAFNVIEDESYAEYYFDITIDDEIDLTPAQATVRNPYSSGIPAFDQSPLRENPPFGDNC